MSFSGRQTTLVAWAIGPAFLVLGVWFLKFSPPADVPRGEVHLVDREQIKPGGIRTPLIDVSKAVVGGNGHQCSECHKLFTPTQRDNRALTQHTDIVLKHGMNARCLNCHDGTDRDKLVLHDGTLVPFTETPRLCSQCHGTVYRDWQRGMHGKTMGSWDASSGKQHRLACNDCHNPHSPAYKQFVPLPGPNTMRMGDQTHEAETERKHTPLRHWSQPGAEQSGYAKPEHKDNLQESKERGS